MVTTTQTRPVSSRRPRLGYPLFDVDVHTSFRRAADLVPYLPQRYRQRFQESGVGDSPATFLSGAGGNREDAVAPDGCPAGTNAPFVAQQLLDPYDIEWAVCTGNGILGLGTIPDADYAAALARAHNDWTLHDWLPQEPRFLGAIVVAQQDPQQAAAEIERVGAHPRVVEVVMSSGNVAPFGQRRYHPIYGAAERSGWPWPSTPARRGAASPPPPPAPATPPGAWSGTPTSASTTWPTPSASSARASSRSTPASPDPPGRGHLLGGPPPVAPGRRLEAAAPGDAPPAGAAQHHLPA